MSLSLISSCVSVLVTAVECMNVQTVRLNLLQSEETTLVYLANTDSNEDGNTADEIMTAVKIYMYLGSFSMFFKT